MKKKNTGLIVLVIVLSLLVVGLGGFIIYDKVLNKNNEVIEKNNNSAEEKNENNIDENLDKVFEISKDTIQELASDTSLNLNTEFSNVDHAVGLYNDDFVSLSINENNKLILKYNGKSSIVHNMDEDIVMLYSSVSCQLSSSIVLILTNKGNIYSFDNSDINDVNSVVYSDILDNINNEKSITLPLTKVNIGKKVLAFTNFKNTKNSGDISGGCDIDFPVVYTDNGDLMEIIIDDNNMRMELFKK